SKTPSIIFSCLHMPDICLHSCIVHISDIAIPSFQLVIITPSFFHRESFYAIDSSFIHLPTLTCLLLLRGLCSWGRLRCTGLRPRCWLLLSDPLVRCFVANRLVHVEAQSYVVSLIHQ